MVGRGSARPVSNLACGLATAGRPYCWGWNAAGQLGDGTSTDRSSPAAVSLSNVPEGKFVAIQPTWTHTCALTAAGKAYCWGGSASGALGDAENYPHAAPGPVTMPAGVAFTDITLGNEHSCALSTANVAYCWGNNEMAQLGVGLPWKPGPVADFPDAAVPGPPDTTAPNGSFTMSRSAFWVGQRTTLTLSGVADDVSGGAAIRRVVTWGDGTTSTLQVPDRRQGPGWQMVTAAQGPGQGQTDGHRGGERLVRPLRQGEHQPADLLTARGPAGGPAGRSDACPTSRAWLPPAPAVHRTKVQPTNRKPNQM